MTEQPGSDPLTDSRRMPRWVPRAIVLFWIGYLATLVARFSFNRLNDLLILLLVSLFVALALEPGVDRMVSRGWKRSSSTITILLGLLLISIGFIIAMGTIVGRQIADLLSNSETYVNDTVRIINDTFNTKINPASVNQQIADPNGPVQKFIDSQQDNVFDLSVQALGMIFQVFSALLFSFYLVADGPRMRRSICSRLSPERQRRVLDTWELAITKTGGYLYSRALLAVISAFFHWIAFQAIGAPAPIAMAMWVGLVSQFLPVIGTYIAGVLPVLLTFIESPIKALIALGFIAVYQQIENYLVAPKVTERTLELHPALAFGGAMGGAALLGPIGAILALPAVAMMQSIFSAMGTRHEVIVDPLTNVEPKKRESKRKERTGWDDPS